MLREYLDLTSAAKPYVFTQLALSWLPRSSTMFGNGRTARFAFLGSCGASSGGACGVVSASGASSGADGDTGGGVTATGRLENDIDAGLRRTSSGDRTNTVVFSSAGLLLALSSVDVVAVAVSDASGVAVAVAADTGLGSFTTT